MPTVEQLKQALADDPDDPILHFSLANKYRDQGQVSEALAHYRLAAKHKPDYSAAWFELARLAEAHGHMDMACEAYRGAMSASTQGGDDHILKAAEVRLRRLQRRT